jgi:hypothetical protein
MCYRAPGPWSGYFYEDNDGETQLDLADLQSIIDLLIEHKKRSEKSLMDSIQGVQIMSELSTIKVQASSTEERLLSRVESIIGRLRGELW